MTAAELASVVSVHQSNVKKEADRLVLDGLLMRVPAPHVGSRRGRKPKAYAFTLEQRAVAGCDLPTRSTAPGVLVRGQEVLVASAESEHVADLLDVLVDAQAAAEVSWIALLGEEILVAFDGPRAARPATELLAVLDAASIPGHRATVAHIGPIDEWTRDGLKVASETARARHRRDKRRADVTHREPRAGGV
ncbi:MAG TPA: hypothetical protein VGX26_06475 [Solirubrobacteraceae bacterium]|nr:hypothetical protein [Solirubrobacteraceae bacterium]